MREFDQMTRRVFAAWRQVGDRLPDLPDEIEGMPAYVSLQCEELRKLDRKLRTLTDRQLVDISNRFFEPEEEDQE